METQAGARTGTGGQRELVGVLPQGGEHRELEGE